MIIRILVPPLNFILDIIIASFFNFPAFIISIFYSNYQIFFKREYILYKNYYQLFFFVLEVSIFSSLKITNLVLIYIFYFLLSVFVKKYIFFSNLLYFLFVFMASVSMHYFIIVPPLKNITIFAYLLLSVLCFVFLRAINEKS